MEDTPWTSFDVDDAFPLWRDDAFSPPQDNSILALPDDPSASELEDEVEFASALEDLDLTLRQNYTEHTPIGTGFNNPPPSDYEPLSLSFLIPESHDSLLHSLELPSESSNGALGVPGDIEMVDTNISDYIGIKNHDVSFLEYGFPKGRSICALSAFFTNHCFIVQ